MGGTTVHEPIELWPGGAPGSEGWTRTELLEQVGPDRRVRNVVRPTLQAYLPEPGVATGTGVVVCPGGGFRILSIDCEGHRVAAWLAARGIAAFVLTHRLVDTGETEESLQASFASLFARPPREVLARMADGVGDLAIADAEAALAHVRSSAAAYGLAEGRLGFLGFSAGGWVTLAVGTGIDASTRPDFLGAIYPGPPEYLVVPSDPEPLFTMVAADDDLCRDVTVELFQAWKAAGGRTELHVYAEGGHGFGLPVEPTLPAHAWLDRFHDWLAAEGLLG